MKEKILISLAAARRNANLTQDEACKELGVSKSTLQSYEEGETFPRIDIAYKIASLYCIPLENLNFFKD